MGAGPPGALRLGGDLEWGRAGPPAAPPSGPPWARRGYAGGDEGSALPAALIALGGCGGGCVAGGISPQAAAPAAVGLVSLPWGGNGGGTTRSVTSGDPTPLRHPRDAAAAGRSWWVEAVGLGGCTDSEQATPALGPGRVGRPDPCSRV